MAALSLAEVSPRALRVPLEVISPEAVIVEEAVTVASCKFDKASITAAPPPAPSQ